MHCTLCQGQRPYSIRTRIKTFLDLLLSNGFGRVRDHIPLEQGLRPSGGGLDSPARARQRPYSIRTRIKTWFIRAGYCEPERQRPYSIRTRIKTNRADAEAGTALKVRDHIPLEQGLRLTAPHLAHGDILVRDHIPLEQGLRHV